MIGHMFALLIISSETVIREIPFKIFQAGNLIRAAFLDVFRLPWLQNENKGQFNSYVVNLHKF